MVIWQLVENKTYIFWSLAWLNKWCCIQISWRVPSRSSVVPRDSLIATNDPVRELYALWTLPWTPWPSVVMNLSARSQWKVKVSQLIPRTLFDFIAFLYYMKPPGIVVAFHLCKFSSPRICLHGSSRARKRICLYLSWLVMVHSKWANCHLSAKTWISQSLDCVSLEHARTSISSYIISSL